ncbi:MAG: T3SS (YopN, CesT) and YbjN peptide-binding chaperone 1 [Myxococcota bacterium]
MTDPSVARSFLVGEVEALEPFAFVAVAPVGRPLHFVEVMRQEGGGLEVRLPGRPPGAPALEADVQQRLQDHGFASEDAADPRKPWTRTAGSAAEAVERLQEVLVEVFGEKPDAAFDLGHGSHEIEHQARKKLEVARTRIEGVLNEMLEKTPERDADGDYLLPIGEVHVVVAPRAAPDGQVVVRIFAITNVGFDVTPDLGLFLARLNFGLMFGRFALDAEHRSIWFDETLLGEQFREEELRFAIRMVATVADGWDDRLKQMFGGSTYQEVLAGRSNQQPPPTKPGEGVGLYL